MEGRANCGVIYGMDRCQNTLFQSCFPLQTENQSYSGSQSNSSCLPTLPHLPLSGPSYDQLQQLLVALEHNANEDGHDCWTYLWGTPFFSSSRAYKHLCGTTIVHPCFRWLWKASVQYKHKVFFCWLLLKDRISTRGLLKRNGMILPSYSFMCPLSTGYRRKSGSFVSSVSLFTTVLAAHPFTDLLTTGSFLNLIRLQITTQCLILYGYHHYNHYNLYVYIQFDRML